MTSIALAKPSIFSRDVIHRMTQVALVGGSASLLFSNQVGLICSVAQVFFSSQHPNLRKEYWFSENLCFEKIKEGFSYFNTALAIQFAVGVFFIISGITFNQIPIQVLRFLIAYVPVKAFLFFIRACFISPVIEEVFFRGFLTDSIRVIQKISFLSKLDGKIQKIHQNFSQALLFGLYHCAPHKGIMNAYYIVSKGSLGFFLGREAEKTNTLFKSISIHTSINIAVIARLLSFKR